MKRKIKILKTAKSRRHGLELSPGTFIFMDTTNKNISKSILSWAQKYDHSAKLTEDNKFIIIDHEKLLLWLNTITDEFKGAPE